MLERIFDMFAQIPRPGREGPGIGLTPARRVVQLHGGTISASADTFLAPVAAMPTPRVGRRGRHCGRKRSGSEPLTAARRLPDCEYHSRIA